MSRERRGGRGKRKRKRGEDTVGIAGRDVVATADKVMGARAGVRKEEMMAEVEEGTAAAGQ